MAGLYDYKFHIGETYTRDDFIFRMEVILAVCDPGEDNLRSTIQKNIAWAKSHPENVVIAWKTGNDGFVYPYIVVGEVKIRHTPPETT